MVVADGHNLVKSLVQRYKEVVIEPELSGSPHIPALLEGLEQILGETETLRDIRPVFDEDGDIYVFRTHYMIGDKEVGLNIPKDSPRGKVLEFFLRNKDVKYSGAEVGINIDMENQMARNTVVNVFKALESDSKVYELKKIPHPSDKRKTFYSFQKRDDAVADADQCELEDVNPLRTIIDRYSTEVLEPLFGNGKITNHLLGDLERVSLDVVSSNMTDGDIYLDGKRYRIGDEHSGKSILRTGHMGKVLELMLDNIGTDYSYDDLIDELNVPMNQIGKIFPVLGDAINYNSSAYRLVNRGTSEIKARSTYSLIRIDDLVDDELVHLRCSRPLGRNYGEKPRKVGRSRGPKRRKRTRKVRSYEYRTSPGIYGDIEITETQCRIGDDRPFSRDSLRGKLLDYLLAHEGQDYSSEQLGRLLWVRPTSAIPVLSPLVKSVNNNSGVYKLSKKPLPEGGSKRLYSLVRREES